MTIYALAKSYMSPADSSLDEQEQQQYELKAFRSTFFHAEMQGAGNRCGDRPYRPSRIIPNVAALPEICFAGIDLLVREDLRGQLAAFDSIDLVRCEIVQVTNLALDDDSLSKTIESYYTWINTDPEMRDHAEWFREQCYPPPPEIRQVDYYEVIAPRFSVVAKHFKCDRAIRPPSWKFADGFVWFEKIYTCPDLHRVYPIVAGDGYYLSEEVHRIIAPYLARYEDMFECIRYEL